MLPKILPIYGSLAINSYGLCIALGILVVIWLFGKNKQAHAVISQEQFASLIIYSIIAGLVGGRALFVATSWQQFENPWQILQVWQGGGSVLGCIIGVLGIIPFFSWKYGVAVLPVLDIAALYAPLLQSISRLGCFLAGCCYGKPTTLFFAITYKNPAVVAPPFCPVTSNTAL